ncbi:hypothetical protein PC129_g16182 [Phytophthora cactorum]|uniref:Transposase IS30-like HTH domain-containing protein n=1 Tax=Phytophthora cactorum TaxID=29920 RepID=A0A8T1C5Q5_9STRA|nr:hypothetical protein Pcac1_g27428 [Phytophthora cactorum]KAG2806834.1 hypothetical protein PC112_g17673 [Phytophthora cactorum]KAG2808468.1 hypothetical protein PC111_g16477 [Phytophthora cactorum]KAG2848286.1 hypothetical protein PC113_g17620 [Phytophthora cactorum]KAG2886486.1 hypothetical protein PC114_g19227 [Phytophthora cactorum]
MPRTKKPPPIKKKPPAAKLKPHLTDRERGRIEGLHEVGVSARDIALVTERSRDTVARVLPSRPEHQDAQALRQLSISTRTIQCTLARVDWLVYTKMVNTLPLKPEDMLARQAWASATLVRKDAGAV